MSEPLSPAPRYSHKFLLKICRSQSARSVPITTEFPSGDNFTDEKLTELKNSSRAYFRFVLSEGECAD